MNNRMTAGARDDRANDVGTLWTMRAQDRGARCALIAWPRDWEIRVVMDGVILIAERCRKPAEAFALAERWKDRLIQLGWEPVVPPAANGLSRSA
ncbi:MAG: hypothetical protein ABIQ52_06625 [Vicinamibacterales bacterium]